MQTKLVEKRERESGIELLKIIAIIMIVLHHVAQTFGTLHMDVYPEYSKYFVDLNIATTNIQQIIITFFWYAGELGNDIFFICSAWFLVDSKNTKLKKVLHIIADVWLVSIVILAFTKVGGYR